MTRLTWRSAASSDAVSVMGLFRVVEQVAPLGLETEPCRRSLTGSWSAPGTWSRQHGGDLPGVLGARCAAADQGRFAVLAGAGFEIARWHQDLVRAVAPPLPSPWLRAVTIVRYSAGYEEAARIAHNEAYADDPGALLPDARSWPQHATGLANFLPDASFLALVGQDIGGFLFSLEHHDSTGTSEASLHCLGTRKPWRRRGLASTMISHALAAYQLAGFTTARLEVDSTNTSTLRLYNQLGFTASGRGYAML